MIENKVRVYEPLEMEKTRMPRISEDNIDHEMMEDYYTSRRMKVMRCCTCSRQDCPKCIPIEGREASVEKRICGSYKLREEE